MGGGGEGAGRRVALRRRGEGGCEEGEDEDREGGKDVDRLGSSRIKHYRFVKIERAETSERTRVAW